MTEDVTGPLKQALEDALSLLRAHGDLDAVGLIASEPLPSLLAQCEMICADLNEGRPPPLRSLHHFACTGGTLISKAVAALPGSVVLSEIDPLSTMHLRGERRLFFPTDILSDLHVGMRPSPPEEICDVFMAGISRLHARLTQRGQTLIIRDHAHTQFCTDVDPAQRPTLHDILTADFPVRALLTCRHPLDSFLSLRESDWTAFTLEEYCQRYELFLEAYSGVARVSYEAFVSDPSATLEQICQILDLPFDPLALDLITLPRLSGDSGRTSVDITLRPRRPICDDVSAQISQSATYEALCAQLGYDPDPDQTPAPAENAVLSAADG